MNGRWVLFPPKTPKSVLKLTSEEAGKNKSEGISWFMLKYPKLVSCNIFLLSCVSQLAKKTFLHVLFDFESYYG